MNIAITKERQLVWAIALFVFFLAVVQFHVDALGFAISVNIADFFVLLALSAILLTYISERRVIVWSIARFNRYVLLTALALLSSWLIAALSGLSLTWGTSKLVGWMVILGYLYTSALLVNQLGFLSFFRFFNLLLVFFLCVLVVSVALFFLEIIKGTGTGAVYVSYMKGLAGNRNALAFQILSVLSLLLAFQPLYERKIIFGRWFLLLATTILTCTMFLTSSRSGIASMLLLYFFALIMRISHWRLLVSSLVLAGVINLFIIYWPEIHFWFFTVSSGQEQIISQVKMAISSDESDLLRGLLIKNTFLMWLEHPFFGAGLGAFYTSSEAVYGVPIVQHNSLLWVLSEMGLLGFILFAVFFVSLIWFVFFTGRRCMRKNAVFLLLLSLGAMAMFHEMLYQRLFWLFLGGMVATGLPDSFTKNLGNEPHGVAEET